MLWRALKDVEQGFYIDLGAAWPDEHSVTKAFYERGWIGINIEPNPVFYDQLVRERVRDINLPLAVSDHDGILTMNIVNDTGLSTLIDAIAEDHRQKGWEIARREVTVTTLNSIWRQYVPTGQDVHFLKIDVEGMEEAALRGLDLRIFRPWIVVVEATLPLSQIDSYETWEPILMQSNYCMAYADGLNRFYVCREREIISRALKYPPNVFDGFKLVAQVEAETRASEAETRASEAETRASEAKLRLEVVEQSLIDMMERAIAAETQCKSEQVALHDARLQYRAVVESKSWRMTGPMRAIGAVLGYDASVRLNIGGRVAAGLIAPFLGNERRAQQLNQWVLRMPRLHRYLRSVALQAGLMREPSAAELAENISQRDGVSFVPLSELPRAAQDIHASFTRLRTAHLNRKFP